MAYENPYLNQLCSAISLNDLQKVMSYAEMYPDLLHMHGAKIAIHVAAEKGHVGIVRWLLGAGCFVNIMDEGGFTALHKAAQQGHWEVVHQLLAYGANPMLKDTSNGDAPIHLAAFRGFPNTVEILSSYSNNKSPVNNHLNTPLHLAAQSGHNQTSRTLLAKGCNLHLKNELGDTALHTAVRYGHACVARILLSAGARTDVNNMEGDTPLHLAAALKRKKIARFLMEYGADTTARNFHQDTAIDIARKMCFEEILSIILNTPPNNYLDKMRRPPLGIQQKLHDTVKAPLPQQQHPAEMQQSVSHKKKSFFSRLFHRKKGGQSKQSKSFSVDEDDPEEGGFLEIRKVNASGVNVLPSQHQTSQPLHRPATRHIPMTTSLEMAATNSSVRPNNMSAVRFNQTDHVRSYPNPNNMQLYRDLAGNILQGPVGYGVPQACTCRQQDLNCQNSKSFYTSPCLIHGYEEFHSDNNQNVPVKAYASPAVVSHPIQGRLFRSRSDESLSISEHKSRQQEQRWKQKQSFQKQSSQFGMASSKQPIMGRRAFQLSRMETMMQQHSRYENVSSMPHRGNLQVRFDLPPNDESESSKLLVFHSHRISPDGENNDLKTSIS